MKQWFVYGITGSRKHHTMSEDITSRSSVTTDDEDQSTPKLSHNSKRISFPADSILNAVIQDGDVVDLLCMLKYNRSEIDLNQTNHSGLTALHHAVITNNLDMAKLLVNNGADVHIPDVHGLSPLHTAAALGLVQMTSFLILFGADVFCHTKKSERPVDFAKDITVIRILYEEMKMRIHNELYARTVLKLILTTVFRLFFNIFKWILKAVFLSMRQIYTTCLSSSRGGPSRDVNISNDSVTPLICTTGKISGNNQPSDRSDMADKKRT